MPEASFDFDIKLQRIVFSRGIEKITSDIFKDCDIIKEIYVPDSVREISWRDWQSKNSWADFRKIKKPKVLGPSGSEAEAFAKQENIEFVEHDDPLKLEPLSDFVVEDDILIRYVGNDDVVEIPGGIKSIGYDAFRSCNFLKEVIIPEGVETIGKDAFWFCHYLEKISLPNTLKEIGVGAFCLCSELTDINLPDRLESISDKAFEQCGFTVVKIPDSVANIGKYAFGECQNLREIYVSEGVQLIGEDAFTNGAFDCSKIEIHTSAGTAAQKYAIDNNITCIVE